MVVVVVDIGDVDGSTSEINDCVGRNGNVNAFDSDDDGWRKNKFNFFDLLLFVVRSCTDVHRCVNVDEDIFILLIRLFFFPFFLFFDIQCITVNLL